MFESAELGHTIDKETYRKEVPKLRAELLDAQFDFREKGKFPVVILISGVDGAGKSETINVLYEWMDPRYLSTLAFSAPTDEEAQRPYMWRFWRALPPKVGNCTDPPAHHLAHSTPIGARRARGEQKNKPVFLKTAPTPSCPGTNKLFTAKKEAARNS